MTLNLLTRAEKGSRLTTAEHDANFTAIETEVNALEGGGSSDSEGITFLFPATGSASRTTESKLAETISLSDFTSLALDGTNDVTSALQEAIDYAEIAYRGSGRSVIEIKGIAVIDYAAMTAMPPAVPITLRVDGMIQTKSCFVVSRNLSIVGVGGYNNFPQFLIGPCCVIEPHSSMGVDHTVQCLEYAYMEGVMVYGNRTGKAAIHVGKRATDPVDGLGQRQSSLIRLNRVGAEAQSGATAAIRIENTFWFWLENFHCGSSGGSVPCILIADSYYPGVGANHSGLIDIKDGVIAYGGIQLGDPASGYSGGGGYHYWFTRVHYESCSAPFVKLAAYSFAHDIYFDRCNIADNISSDSFIDNASGTLCYGLYMHEINMMYGLRPWKGRPPTGTIKIDGFFPFIGEGGYDLLNCIHGKSEVNLQGEVEACNSFRGGDFAPQMLPAGVTHLLQSQDITAFAKDATVTVTGGQTAPDGSATAYRIQSSGAGTTIWSDTGVTGMTDDWVLYGGWFRAPDQTKQIVMTQAQPAIRIAALGSSGQYWNEVTSDNTTQEFGTKYIHLTSIQVGWVFISDLHAYHATTSPNTFRFHMLVPPTTGDLLAWRPFCIRLPRSQFSRRDARRILSNLSLVDVSIPSGTLGQLSHHTFRTGAGATGSRPTASTVGAGAQWFDTSISQPIWSDGSNWVSPLTLRERTITTANTIAAADHGKRIICTSAATHTVSNAATLGAGFECEVVNDSGGNVILDGPGGTNVTMADGEVVTLICANSKIRVAKGTSTVIS